MFLTPNNKMVLSHKLKTGLKNALVAFITISAAQLTLHKPPNTFQSPKPPSAATISILNQPRAPISKRRTSKEYQGLAASAPK